MTILISPLNIISNIVILALTFYLFVSLKATKRKPTTKKRKEKLDNGLCVVREYHRKGSHLEV
jgi:hypothetical protein